jgi:hypothetical protein
MDEDACAGVEEAERGVVEDTGVDGVRKGNAVFEP